MTGDVRASRAPAAAAEARMIDVRSTLTTHRPSLTHVSGRRMPASQRFLSQIVFRFAPLTDEIRDTYNSPRHVTISTGPNNRKIDNF